MQHINVTRHIRWINASTIINLAKKVITLKIINRVAGGGPVCKHMCRECLFIFIISDYMCTGKYEVDFAYPGNK